MGQSISSLEFRSPTQICTQYGLASSPNVNPNNSAQSHLKQYNDNVNTVPLPQSNLVRPVYFPMDPIEHNQPVLFIRLVFVCLFFGGELKFQLLLLIFTCS